MTNGPAILARRRHLRMTQDHLAGAAGISRSTVQRAERGMAVSDENLRSLLAVLQMTAEELATPIASGHPPAPDPAGVARVGRNEMLLAIGVFLAFLVPCMNARWFDGFADTPVGATQKFWALGCYLLLVWFTCMVQGRIIWRHLRHPDADGMAFARPVVLFGRSLAVPGLRWSKGGKAVSTWPGAVAVTMVWIAATFVLHYSWANKPFLGTVLEEAGFQSTPRASGAWHVMPGSPMDRAGVRIGDQVLSVDGNAVANRRDLVAVVLESEGRTLDLVVARPRTSESQERGADIVRLRLDVSRNPACQKGVPCGWAGDVTGLFTPTRIPSSFEDDVRAFAGEVWTVARMAVNPSMSARSEMIGEYPAEFRYWKQWLTFRVTAGTAIGIMAFTLILMVSLSGAVLDTRRLFRNAGVGLGKPNPLGA